MTRVALLLSSLIVAVAVAAPAQAARAAAVTVAACATQGPAAARGAAFEARMLRIPGAARLAMRFTLQARSRSRPRWHAVAAPGWGRWETSEPGVRAYVYTKQVLNLSGPAAYRALVRFRWVRADGDVSARQVRHSRTCRQPDPRPDLRVTEIARTVSSYRVRVRNAGGRSSVASDLALEVGLAPQPPVPLAALAPGESALVEVAAPGCVGDEVVAARADASSLVDEGFETNNSLRRACSLLRVL